MANGAPRHNQTMPKPTNEQERKAQEMLEQAAATVATLPPFFEVVEVRQYNVSLIQVSENSYALCHDTPGGRRYVFPMDRQTLDRLSEMFTKAKLGIPPQGGAPAMPQGAGQ